MKRASWCRARIRPYISYTNWEASVSPRRSPLSTAWRTQRSKAACPRADHRQQLFADRARTVVILDGAADIDAARGDFHAHTFDPVGKHGAQARQATGLLHRRVKHFLLETMVVQLQHFNLQIFSRTKVREHTGLTHVHLIGEQTNGEAFKTVTACQVEGHIQDGRTGHFAFAHEFSWCIYKNATHFWTHPERRKNLILALTDRPLVKSFANVRTIIQRVAKVKRHY